MMKNFKVYNNDLDHWVERKFTHASYVVEFLKSRDYFDYNFEIEWKSPVTDEYGVLMTCENGKFTYINRYLYWEMPSVFKKLIKKIDKNSIKEETKKETETETETEEGNMDISTRIYKDVFGLTLNETGVNQHVKAVIINFGDERGDIIVENDNFGTRRKHADFTKGKEKAGLHPLQIVFPGLDLAHICKDRYINENDEICYF